MSSKQQFWYFLIVGKTLPMRIRRKGGSRIASFTVLPERSNMRYFRFGDFAHQFCAKRTYDHRDAHPKSAVLVVELSVSGSMREAPRSIALSIRSKLPLTPGL